MTEPAGRPHVVVGTRLVATVRATTDRPVAILITEDDQGRRTELELTPQLVLHTLLQFAQFAERYYRTIDT